MPKTNSVLSNLKFSIKKLLFLVQGYDRIHISSIFDSKNAFANFHTHDFMGSKHMLKCFSLGCKHYEALFRTKWSSQTQKVKIFIKWLQVIVQYTTNHKSMHYCCCCIKLFLHALNLYISYLVQNIYIVIYTTLAGV